MKKTLTKWFWIVLPVVLGMVVWTEIQSYYIAARNKVVSTVMRVQIPQPSAVLLYIPMARR